MQITVDTLAQKIRLVNGNNQLGAGALAEALMPFLKAALSLPVQPVAWPEGFFKLGGDNRLRECASDGCHQHVSIRVERGGVGSDHCEPCARKIADLLTTPPVPPTKGPEDDLIAALEGVKVLISNARGLYAKLAYEKIDKLLALRSRPASALPVVGEDCHGIDTPERVCFYEQDFYVLSNFSSFRIRWDGQRFPTSEHLYHWEKFRTSRPAVAEAVRNAPSAHEAFKLAEGNKHLRRPDWDDVKVDIMRDILRAKANQHEYVLRKLLATGDRELVENSWRDDFWGWGPNRDGKNMLGKLWMEVRAELSSALTPSVQP